MASGRPARRPTPGRFATGRSRARNNIQTITYTAGASGNVKLSLTVTNASGVARRTRLWSRSTRTLAADDHARRSNSLPWLDREHGERASGRDDLRLDDQLTGRSRARPTIQNITYTAGGPGTVTLNLTVTNAAGCSASNSAIVSASDTTDPGNYFLPARSDRASDGGSVSRRLSLRARLPRLTTAATPTITFTRSDGQLTLSAPYLVGTTTITWKATDAANRMATCPQTITVQDLQPPVITCPANQTGVTDFERSHRY
jgi:PKD repeat protein